MSGGLIGPEYDAQIRDVIRSDRQRKRTSSEVVEAIPRRKPSAYSRHQAILLADLPAAVNTKRDPSTAQAIVLRRNATGDLTRSNLTLTIVNRFVNISIDAGTYIKIEHIDGEWQPYAADCPGGSLSESL
jgi:hypothetical protein